MVLHAAHAALGPLGVSSFSSELADRPASDSPTAVTSNEGSPDCPAPSGSTGISMPGWTFRTEERKTLVAMAESVSLSEQVAMSPEVQAATPGASGASSSTPS